MHLMTHTIIISDFCEVRGAGAPGWSQGSRRAPIQGHFFGPAKFQERVELIS